MPPTESDDREPVRVELHSHTIHSDGVLSPADLVRAAADAGLAALAITDHDTVAGVAAAREAGETGHVDVVGGIEFSARANDHDIHLLGLFIDEHDDELLEATERYRRIRHERARRMLGKLESLGAPVTMEAVERISGPGSIGRPHVADALVEAGHVPSANHAFRRYIGVGRPAYVRKPALDAADLIRRIHGAGGLAILAHPGSSRVPLSVVRRLADAELDGLEIEHPKHRRGDVKRLRGWARRLSLLTTSGSDYHGPGRGDTALGEYSVSGERFRRLRRESARYA